MREPSCIAPDCMFYSRKDEVCMIDDEGELLCCCPCLNGELVAGIDYDE